MITVDGKYNTAIVYSDTTENETISQIISLCNQEFVKDSKIRMMPDLHAGKGCVIGTTMTIQNKIVPNLVGVDINCGIFCVNLGKIELDFEKIDKFIRNKIPHGNRNNKEPVTNFKDQINNLICLRDLHKSASEFNLAIGSLGGGNHFIEIDIDNEGNHYLVVHSGSRNMGLQIANYYQDRAFDYHNGINEEFEIAKQHLIEEYKVAGKRNQIQNALAVLAKQFKKESSIPKDFCYLEGRLLDDYLHDMKIAQEFATLNRQVIAKRIIDNCTDLDYNHLVSFTTIHNYIDVDNMILRKGAVSAQLGEVLIIPINMRDGSIIAIGKGNPDWNYSAPHGAGRLMSRSKAKEALSLDEYKITMKDIYSSSVTESTLDESPMAYKPIEEIIENTKDTITIDKIVRPVYNFKSG